ncbi:MAG: VWA domain-containing protein [Acidobacteria bacterium]|nr:VWA domain-containing protein [Acidobacteriota bacterium]
MGALIELARRLGSSFEELRTLTFQDLRFWHGDEARLTAIALVAVAAAMLVVRSTLRVRGSRERVGLPALLAPLERRSWAFARHVPLVLLVSGLPLLVLALADPYTALPQQRDTFPGRRICLLIDASSSMTRPFQAPGLSRGGTATFFATVAAADRFVQLRTQGPYRDLMALVEFGDQAYVVTPFTTDYDNIRLSLSLIGDLGEYVRFPDQGTILTRAIEQGVQLFETFDFLDASGNLLVIFSDGEDAEVAHQGGTVAGVVRAAVAAEVPIYFVRTRYGQAFGSVVSDAEWRAAVERTGGRFYAAGDEAAILSAIQDIDRASAGEIEIAQYVNERAAFGPFALAAASLWSLGAALMLAVPYFRRFP